jgi:hypothetical protein
MIIVRMEMKHVLWLGSGFPSFDYTLMTRVSTSHANDIRGMLELATHLSKREE